MNMTRVLVNSPDTKCFSFDVDGDHPRILAAIDDRLQTVVTNTATLYEYNEIVSACSLRSPTPAPLEQRSTLQSF